MELAFTPMHCYWGTVAAVGLQQLEGLHVVWQRMGCIQWQAAVVHWGPAHFACRERLACIGVGCCEMISIVNDCAGLLLMQAQVLYCSASPVLRWVWLVVAQSSGLHLLTWRSSTTSD